MVPSEAAQVCSEIFTCDVRVRLKVVSLVIRHRSTYIDCSRRLEGRYDGRHGNLCRL